MPTVSAYATAGPRVPFAPTTIERRDVGPLDVRIAIAYTGICHSDIHTAREEWGTIEYPFVPGHEIAGVVEAVGAEVTKFAVGDRVGVGCMVDSCGECRHCLADKQQYCRTGVFTYNSRGKDGIITQGGYSTHIVVTEGFVLRIPDALALDVAAPLLCAGITMYSPLKHWNAGPGTRVAVAGIGGLGHMALKLAHAMGCEVTALTRTDAKAEDALRLGADQSSAMADGTAFKKLRGSFDLILNTMSEVSDLNAYLGLLDVDGTMVNVGLPEGEVSLNLGMLATARRSLAGSNIGGIAQTQEMLDFAASRSLGADIELIGSDQIDDAWNRVVRGDVRYRFVIDAATFA